VARVYDAILGGTDNFAADRAVAEQALRQWEMRGRARLNRAALGRYLQVTHFGNASVQAVTNGEVLRRGLGRGQTRTREQIARFFDGLDFVSSGLVYLIEWRPMNRCDKANHRAGTTSRSES
jgi:hypothetical protein